MVAQPAAICDPPTALCSLLLFGTASCSPNWGARPAGASIQPAALCSLPTCGFCKLQSYWESELNRTNLTAGKNFDVRQWLIAAHPGHFHFELIHREEKRGSPSLLYTAEIRAYLFLAPSL
jgi:hypothetical protein